MALNSFTSGINTSLSSELNENYKGFAIQEVYTGNGFDRTGTAGSTAYELTAVSSSSIGSADYAIVDVNVQTYANNDSNGSSKGASLKIEVKETGSSYSTVYNDNLCDLSDEQKMDSPVHVRALVTLTAGMKSNGFQIQITGTNTYTSSYARLSNNFTTITLVAGN